MNALEILRITSHQRIDAATEAAKAAVSLHAARELVCVKAKVEKFNRSAGQMRRYRGK